MFGVWLHRKRGSIICSSSFAVCCLPLNIVIIISMYHLTVNLSILCLDHRFNSLKFLLMMRLELHGRRYNKSVFRIEVFPLSNVLKRFTCSKRLVLWKKFNEKKSAQMAKQSTSLNRKKIMDTLNKKNRNDERKKSWNFDSSTCKNWSRKTNRSAVATKQRAAKMRK